MPTGRAQMPRIASSPAVVWLPCGAATLDPLRSKRVLKRRHAALRQVQDRPPGVATTWPCARSMLDRRAGRISPKQVNYPPLNYP